MLGEETGATAAVAEEPKKKSKTILLILGTAVLVLGAAVAGVFLGPKFLQGEQQAAPTPSAETEPVKEQVIKETLNIPPIIVDTRDSADTTRHVKVALTLELAEGSTMDELKNYVPRGRESAIGYLRSQRFEALTDPDRFDNVREELSKRIIEAAGEKRVARVLITDFVAQ
jgi:flagellar basal body-associated protein FliL